jgi:hypothetical protein
VTEENEVLVTRCTTTWGTPIRFVYYFASVQVCKIMVVPCIPFGTSLLVMFIRSRVVWNSWCASGARIMTLSFKWNIHIGLVVNKQWLRLPPWGEGGRRRRLRPTIKSVAFPTWFLHFNTFQGTNERCRFETDRSSSAWGRLWRMAILKERNRPIISWAIRQPAFHKLNFQLHLNYRAQARVSAESLSSESALFLHLSASSLDLLILFWFVLRRYPVRVFTHILKVTSEIIVHP